MDDIMATGPECAGAGVAPGRSGMVPVAWRFGDRASQAKQIDGPRCGEPAIERQRFMAAMSLEIPSFALTATRSPCRGG